MEEEESEVPGMEEDVERNEAFVPLNSDCYGCCPEEDITDDVQDGVCVMFWSLLLLFFLFILSIFCSPEQFIPSEPIWEWSCPLFFDEDK